MNYTEKHVAYIKDMLTFPGDRSSHGMSGNELLKEYVECLSGTQLSNDEYLILQQRGKTIDASIRTMLATLSESDYENMVSTETSVDLGQNLKRYISEEYNSFKGPHFPRTK